MPDEIHVCDYDPRWPALFAAEAPRVRAALGEDLVLAVEHFGSTAVPGLAAKPVIDILVVARSVEAARARVPELAALGYAYWYENPKTDRLFFVKGLPPNGPRTHHVHVGEPGGELCDRLLFRDYLRAHSDEAARYAELKRALAVRHTEDREAYTEAKTEYIAAVMERARKETAP